GGGGNKQAAEFTAVSNYCFGIVDWPANGRFGYTRVAGSAWSSINMLTVQFYDLMADTARELGDTANIAVYEGYAQTLRDRINETFLTNNTASDIDQNGVSRWKYADNVTSAGAQNNHFGQHSTSYALAFDIAPQEYRESMLDYIASLGMRQGPMTVNYLVEAFCENNRPVDLLNLLTNPDDLGWAHALLHQNFTYSPEEWEPYSGTNSFGNSESHGWGAASIVEMYEYVAGVKNAEAGGKSIIINPFMSGALDWVDGVVYTSRGPVTTSYSGEGADLTLKIDVPPNIQAEVLMPIVENGVFVEKNGLDGESEFTDDYQIISVGSGVREFVYERRIYANIRSDEALAGINSPVSYTVSLTDAIGAGVVSLSFIADSRYLDLPTATALNGFTILEPLSWEYIGAQLWKGSIKLYCPNFVQSSDPVDILRISGVTLGLLGNTTVTLSDVKATGDISGYSGDIPCVITVGDATINIVLRTVFSKYDLNHDGKIDELDLAIVVYYYLANDLESDWAVVKFDIASAKDCDVAVNGRVDLADMIEVIANYCDSY
ncbi:MAG: hypothetical protein FWH55_14185, partial [Oscillospiraceae bacterium]|nr:hypothetical protein [Oscillospiraceae bacterium]